jgi:hypothetical protein
MPTIAELETAFRVHLDEMDCCVQGKCFWALLHLVVVIPDICGALEAPSGEATKSSYVDWCRRMFPPVPPVALAPEERYELRCILLHQGRTLATKGRYSFFKFTRPQPNLSGTTVHNQQFASDQITLDVDELAKETRRALRDWFEDLQDPAQVTRAAIVARNLPTIVTVKAQPVPGIGGFMVDVTHTSTST